MLHISMTQIRASVHVSHKSVLRISIMMKRHAVVAVINI